MWRRFRPLAPTHRGPLAPLAVLAGAALALSSMGCSLVAGVHEVETEFVVKPGSTPNFSGWSEITISEDPRSVDGADLMYIRLEAQDSSVRDLTFIQSITAEVKVDETLTRVAEKAPMPKGERIVPLDLVYKGDLRQFFYDDPDGDGYTVHIAWSGQVDLSHPIPAEGIRMLVKMAVNIKD